MQVRVIKHFMFQLAEVVYVGYGNKETVWSKDLLPPVVPSDVDLVTEDPVDAVAAQDVVAELPATQVSFGFVNLILILLSRITRLGLV